MNKLRNTYELNMQPKDEFQTDGVVSRAEGDSEDASLSIAPQIFPKLPLELRWKIYAFIVAPRVVAIEEHDDREVSGDGAQHALRRSTPGSISNMLEASQEFSDWYHGVGMTGFSKKHDYAEKVFQYGLLNEFAEGASEGWDKDWSAYIPIVKDNGI